MPTKPTRSISLSLLNHVKGRTPGKLLFIILVIIFLTGCGSPLAAETLPPTPSLTPPPTETPVFQAGATPVPVLLTQVAITPKPTASPTVTLKTPTTSSAESALPTSALSMTAEPTPDLRLDPENWQAWPVVPDRVGAAMQQVYRSGLAAGNNPNAFSKVGDCQNVPNAFLGFFDTRGSFQLIGDFARAQGAVDHFAGSFSRESQAVRGGFNVASVLSPFWADLSACAQGETPLECEFRLYRPSIVFISMETWFEGRTTDTYIRYLRQIIEFSLEHGAVPILATKADNTEGDHSINLAIATLAYEYDVPLWNFWLAVQPLKDHGIDWARDRDGFHITVEAWNVRSFTALAALDSVWQLLNAPDQEPPSILPTSTAVVVEGAEPPEFVLGALQGSGANNSQRVWLSLGERIGGVESFSGVLQLDTGTGQLSQITRSGYRLLDVSPDGHNFLLSQDASLFLVDFDPNNLDAAPKVQALSTNFLSSSSGGAVFLPEPGHLTFIEKSPQAGGATALMLYTNADASAVRISLPDQTPIQIYPAQSGSILYWENGVCTSDYTNCQPVGVHSTDWRSLQQSEFNEMLGPSIGPDGSLAYVTKSMEGKRRLYILPPGVSIERLMLSTADIFEGYWWSPDGKTLLVIKANQSDYSNRVLKRQFLLLNATDFSVRQLNLDQDTPATQAVWSPDGQSILLFGLEAQSGAGRMLSWRVNTGTTAIDELVPIELGWGEQYPYLQGSFWLP